MNKNMEAKAKFSIERELNTKPMTEDMKSRWDKLDTILKKNGMDIRDDSRLTFNYISRDGDVHLVAHELLCMNFLFTHTNYDQLCQTGLKYIANELKQKYNLPWKQTWSITREYAVPAMKMYALAESGLSMPEFDIW